MNILHISKYYFPYNGGIENTCQQIVEGFPNSKTAVVCFSQNQKNTIDVINGIKIYRAGVDCTIFRQSISHSYIRILKRAIKEFNPDIIHLHWCNPFGGAMLLLTIPKCCKLIIHWHSDIVNQKIIYYLIKPIETALLKRANMVLTTSPLYIEGSNPLKPFRSKVKVLQSAIDTSKFILSADDKKEIEKIQKKYQYKPIVFFIGRHVPYKGIHFLIEAEKHISSDCVILVAGKGPLTKKIKKECTSKRVHFLGRVSDYELKCLNAAASVLAFPSITKQEAFGLALVEGMYSKSVPVCFTIKGSGVNWVSIKDETGLEVKNQDIIGYANAVDILLNDNKLRNTLATNAKKRVEKNFTVPVMLNILGNYYHDILNKKI